MKPKGYFKEGGKTKPITPKKGITEDQMKISVKGNNDTIEVGAKKPTSGMKGNRESGIKTDRENFKEKFEQAEKKWKLEVDNGDTMIYRNIADPSLTVEMHHDYEEPENDDEKAYEFWYFFPARNGKGIHNSPHVYSESGGYTQDDARQKFKKMLIDTSSEL